MALLSIDHFAKSLRLCMTCTVILPEDAPGLVGMEGKDAAGGDGRYPTLWLLHGGTDDHTIWQRRTSIERYLAPLGMAAVMPNVHLSRYANMVHGGKYWDYLSEELPEMLERWLPLATTRERRYVAGLSMGGWGTFKWALNHPDRFAAAASLSGAVRMDFKRWKDSGKKRGNRDLVYGDGDDFPYPEDRLEERVKDHLANGTPLPRLYACCGTEDFLLEDNRVGVAKLRELGATVDYEEGPGSHNWGFWDAWIQRALRWMGFDIEPPEVGAKAK